MDDERFSTSKRGELHFAESRDVAHAVSPDRFLVAREGVELEEEVLACQLLIHEAEELGNDELIGKAEDRLNDAVSRLAEWEGCESEEVMSLPYMPLAHALAKQDGREGETSAEEMENRVRDWEVFLSYVFQDGYANPWEGFKNFLAAVRRISPQYLGGMTGAEVAAILGEEKASESARGIRFLEDKLKQWNVLGSHGLGATKSETARENCAKAQKGNTNRRTGSRRKKKEGRHGTVSSAAAALGKGGKV